MDRIYYQSCDLRASYSCLKPEGIIEFQDDIRARGMILVLVVEEVVINHQVEVLSGFWKKVQSAMNAQVP
jgi:hypothetical protein